MNPGLEVDVAVIGAGPSGASAALRLLAFGYRVALIDRLAFPRPQVGESLSPGVWNILEFLDAATEIRRSAILNDLPARIAWESREPRLIKGEERGPGVMVDRGEFDARQANLAERRGAFRFHPARVRRADGKPGERRLLVVGPERETMIQARWIVDARGRSGWSTPARFATGPATLAVWSHVAEELFPRESRVEAIDRAWLWGSPLTDGRYRVMAFLSPESRPEGESLELHFRRLLADGGLFEAASKAAFVSPLFTRLATPYLDPQPWQPGATGVGEKVMALDPLSSSGVEKSMRQALQVAVAVNTVLRDPREADLARSFYEARLVESAALHARWTRDYYARAWPGPGQAFWRDRSSVTFQGGDTGGLIARFHVASEQLEAQHQKISAGDATPNDFHKNRLANAAQLTARVSLSPESRFVEAACVVDDRIRLMNAVEHPDLASPVTFLAETELVPLLKLTSNASDLGHLLLLWSRFVPAPTAWRLMLWLLQRGILKVDPNDG